MRATGRSYSAIVVTPSSGSRWSGLAGAFRAVAFVEAATYLLLLAAVVVYRVFDGPDLIGILGPVHGVSFLVYLALVMRIRDGQGWGFWRTVVVIVAAAVPLGGFWAGRHLVEDQRSTAPHGGALSRDGGVPGGGGVEW